MIAEMKIDRQNLVVTAIAFRRGAGLYFAEDKRACLRNMIDEIGAKTDGFTAALLLFLTNAASTIIRDAKPHLATPAALREDRFGSVFPW